MFKNPTTNTSCFLRKLLSDLRCVLPAVGAVGQTQLCWFLRTFPSGMSRILCVGPHLPEISGPTAVAHVSKSQCSRPSVSKGFGSRTPLGCQNPPRLKSLISDGTVFAHDPRVSSVCSKFFLGHSYCPLWYQWCGHVAYSREFVHFSTGAVKRKEVSPSGDCLAALLCEALDAVPRAPVTPASQTAAGRRLP